MTAAPGSTPHLVVADPSRPKMLGRVGNYSPVTTGLSTLSRAPPTSRADDRYGDRVTAVEWDPDAVPAATVVVLRDAPGGPEVLMLRRDAALSFAGGMWVFPGGRIDPTDHPAGGHDLELAARQAAAREAREEAGLVIDPDALRRWSHWTPPPRQDKRFTTAFFVAPAAEADAVVVVDDGEIREHRWATPEVVLQLRDAGEIVLAPPTFITLTQLLPHRHVDDVLAAADRPDREVEHFATRIVTVGERWLALYHGDVAYDGGDPEAPGPRHRLLMDATWTYVRDPR
jgi:8-oxo-dGTP pyrophosphatase MutT (NUDIX family)